MKKIPENEPLVIWNYANRLNERIDNLYMMIKINSIAITFIAIALTIHCIK